MPLLENLKAHKGQVVEHLSRQAYFAGMFKKDLEEVNRQYQPGTIQYIKATHPELWKRIVDAEDKMSEAWLRGIADEFQNSLEEWRDLNLKGIEIFRDRRITPWELFPGGEDKSA